MRLSLVALLSIPLLIACGQEKSHAVYDTANNPDNFPPAAVEVISQIESGKLVGSDAITEAFGNLLTEHGDLLDRPEWRQAVDNMGGLFRQTADSLAGQGIGSFSLAAEYYQLGLLARPEDTSMRRLSGMFGAWREALRDETVSASVRQGDFGSLDAILEISRQLLSRGFHARQFLRTCLAPEIRKWADSSGLMATETISGRTAADRALLASAGLADTTGLGKLAAFGESGIDLVAARITQFDSTSYRTEFYFLPNRPVPDSLKVFLRISSKEGGFLQKEFIPQPPTTVWTPGQVVLVAGALEYESDVYAAAVGLADFTLPRPNFIKPVNWRTDLFLVPDTNIVRK